MLLSFTLELGKCAASSSWLTCRLENPFHFTSGHFWAGKYLCVPQHHLCFSLSVSKDGFPQKVAILLLKGLNQPKICCSAWLMF